MGYMNIKIMQINPASSSSVMVVSPQPSVSLCNWSKTLWFSSTYSESLIAFPAPHHRTAVLLSSLLAIQLVGWAESQMPR